jgi:predicted phosphodiesterase
MAFRIGIISDTHGLLRPEAERFLAGVDHIIHGGDIGNPDIIATLRRIAPVTAIRGNVDTGRWADAYAETVLSSATISFWATFNEMSSSTFSVSKVFSILLNAITGDTMSCADARKFMRWPVTPWNWPYT